MYTDNGDNDNVSYDTNPYNTSSYNTNSYNTNSYDISSFNDNDDNSNNNINNSNKSSLGKIIVCVLLLIVLLAMVYFALGKGKKGKETGNDDESTNYIVQITTDKIEVSKGGSLSLSVKVFNDKNVEVSNQNVTWKTDDGSIANMSGNVINGVGLGKTKVTATYTSSAGQTFSGSKDASVFEGDANTTLTNVSIDTSSLNLQVNETHQINITLTPPNGRVNSKTFTSSNTGVVMVDSNGLIAAVGEGSATVEVNINGSFYKTIQITVVSDYMITSTPYITMGPVITVAPGPTNTPAPTKTPKPSASSKTPTPTPEPGKKWKCCYVDANNWQFEQLASNEKCSNGGEKHGETSSLCKGATPKPTATPTPADGKKWKCCYVDANNWQMEQLASNEKCSNGGEKHGETSSLCKGATPKPTATPTPSASSKTPTPKPTKTATPKPTKTATPKPTASACSEFPWTARVTCSGQFGSGKSTYYSFRTEFECNKKCNSISTTCSCSCSYQCK